MRLRDNHKVRLSVVLAGFHLFLTQKLHVLHSEPVKLQRNILLQVKSRAQTLIMNYLYLKISDRSVLPFQSLSLRKGTRYQTCRVTTMTMSTARKNNSVTTEAPHSDQFRGHLKLFLRLVQFQRNRVRWCELWDLPPNLSLQCHLSLKSHHFERHSFALNIALSLRPLFKPREGE